MGRSDPLQSRRHPLTLPHKPSFLFVSSYGQRMIHLTFFHDFCHTTGKGISRLPILFYFSNVVWNWCSHLLDPSHFLRPIPIPLYIHPLPSHVGINEAGILIPADLCNSVCHVPSNSPTSSFQLLWPHQCFTDTKSFVGTCHFAPDFLFLPKDFPGFPCDCTF